MMQWDKKKLNQEIIDPLLEKEILIGYCNRMAYDIPKYKRWFDSWYEKQEPERFFLDKLHPDFLQSLEIVIITATWCGKCRTEITRFYKIFDSLKINYDNVTVIYVNRKKQIPGINLSGFSFTRVPTFIFNKQGKEIGRIIEQPKDTLEAELFILQENNKK